MVPKSYKENIMALLQWRKGDASRLIQYCCEDILVADIFVDEFVLLLIKNEKWLSFTNRLFF